MLTTDLALRFDPTYEKIARRFMEHPDEFAQAFAKAWYKLLHRDMGPVSRYLGPWVPEPQLWQDPVPAVDHELVGDAEIADLKRRLLDSGLSSAQLVATAWGAAASFRGTDKRGGANGARIRLAPQKDWAVNEPAALTEALQKLEEVRRDFNAAQTGNVRISLADLIVLGGCAAVEMAAKDAGFDITVPFAPGRTDASQEQTDVESFSVLEPTADGFRNYLRPGEKIAPETKLVDRAYMLNLSAPEMTVLVGGMRALGANYGGSPLGVLTDRPGTLTNDFFVNLLDMGTEWKVSESQENVYEGYDRATGDLKWTATAVDLVFGANSQLRALCEVYGAEDGNEKFVRDFVAAWDKVMNLDRFDLHR
jgi:catalase-peroxidase